MDIASGGFKVCYEDDDNAKELLVSPDDIVLAKPRVAKRTLPSKPAVTPEKDSKKQKTTRKNYFYGVHEDYDEDGYYYIRGKLRDVGDPCGIPLLLFGQLVRYNRCDDTTHVEWLTYDHRQERHFMIEPRKNGKCKECEDFRKYMHCQDVKECLECEEFSECEKCVQRAEREHAARIKAAPSPEKIEFRRLQPVHVAGSGDAVIVRLEGKSWAQVKIVDTQKEARKEISEISLI